VHALFKLLAWLFAAPLLQKVVILTYHDGSVRLSGGHTLRAQRTASTMVTPFEAITNFLTLGFLFARPRLEPRTNPLKGRLSAFIKRYSSGSYAYPISGCSICCSLRLFFAPSPAFREKQLFPRSNEVTEAIPRSTERLVSAFLESVNTAGHAIEILKAKAPHQTGCGAGS